MGNERVLALWRLSLRNVWMPEECAVQTLRIYMESAFRPAATRLHLPTHERADVPITDLPAQANAICHECLPMTTDPDIAAIAREMTKARKEMILALPADGSWGSVPSRDEAVQAWWDMLPDAIEHRHSPLDRVEWALNNFGLRVRQYLQETARG